MSCNMFQAFPAVRMRVRAWGGEEKCTIEVHGEGLHGQVMPGTVVNIKLCTAYMTSYIHARQHIANFSNFIVFSCPDPMHPESSGHFQHFIKNVTFLQVFEKQSTGSKLHSVIWLGGV